MPKYLVKASYTAEGAKGLLKEGGTKRREAVKKVIESLGGKLEGFYFAFGEGDAFVLSDMPDAASAAALALTVGASGAARCSTIVLMTPEEVDQAAKKKVAYRAPGQ